MGMVSINDHRDVDEVPAEELERIVDRIVAVAGDEWEGMDVCEERMEEMMNDITNGVGSLTENRNVVGADVFSGIRRWVAMKLTRVMNDVDRAFTIGAIVEDVRTIHGDEWGDATSKALTKEVTRMQSDGLNQVSDNFAMGSRIEVLIRENLLARRAAKPTFDEAEAA